MAEETATAGESTAGNKRKAESFPTEGYVCNLCGVSGHWIQQCSQKPKRKKQKKKSSSSHHVYTPGVDPSPKDIERAKQMQKLVPPECDCGVPSRLKKVKKSRVTENSRANGSYFFFCSKKRDDTTRCKFARPVEQEHKTEQERKTANFFAKKRKAKSASSSSPQR